MVLAILFDSAGFGEWFVLLAVVLIVVGPKRLPETARKIGNIYSKFRRAAENFKRELLDMDRSVTNFIDETEKTAEDAFKVEGDESEKTPGESDGDEPDGENEGDAYGGPDGYPYGGGESDASHESGASTESGASGESDDEPPPRMED
jgi:Tat protein translocase TatB subunit